MLYPNLRAEIARAGITQKILAEKCNIPYSTFRCKMSGRVQFLFIEAVQIKNVLRKIQGEELPPLEILFKEN